MRLRLRRTQTLGMCVGWLVCSVSFLSIEACIGDAPIVEPLADASTAVVDAGKNDDGQTSTDGSVPTDGPVSPDAADADAGFTPLALPGLLLWLDGANVEVDGANLVTRWPDQSGLNNFAHPVLGGPSEAPLRIVAEPKLANKGAVRFGGPPSSDAGTLRTELIVDNSASLKLGTSSFTIALVGFHTNPLSVPNDQYCYGFFFLRQAPTFPYVGPGLIANTPDCTSNVVGRLGFDNVVNSSGSGFDNGAAHVFVLSRSVNGVVGTLSLRIDGSPAGSSTDVPPDAGFVRDVDSADAFHIGGTTMSDQSLRGDVAEMVMLKSDLTPGDLALLEAYLKGKYGL